MCRPLVTVGELEAYRVDGSEHCPHESWVPELGCKLDLADLSI